METVEEEDNGQMESVRGRGYEVLWYKCVVMGRLNQVGERKKN